MFLDPEMERPRLIAPSAAPGKSEDDEREERGKKVEGGEGGELAPRYAQSINLVFLLHVPHF